MSNRVPSHTRFLVDIGAQLSVIAPTPADRPCPKAGLFLQAVNTSPITTFRTCSLFWDIDLRHLFLWVLVVADIPCAFLSADFLAAFDLLVDCRQSRLHDKTTNLTVWGISSSDASRQLAVLDPEPENPLRQLPAKHPGLTHLNFSTTIPPQVHHIQTTGPPMFPRPRRLVPARLAAAKAEFEHMLQMGIIRQSESPRASLLHVIPKAATGDCRPHGDNRALNNIAVPDSCPVPHLQDFTGALFSKLRPFPPPSSKRQLQRCLSMVNLYSRSLPHCADTILKLTSLLPGAKGVLELSADALAAFENVEVALAYATLLTHFPLDAPTSLMADVSTVVEGTVLQQHLQITPNS
nr:unnamed protein product [Spirometra erinaceieuropaei]